MNKLTWIMCCVLIGLGCSPEGGEPELASEAFGFGAKADQACNASDVVDSDTTADADNRADGSFPNSLTIDAEDAVGADTLADSQSNDSDNDNVDEAEEATEEFVPESAATQPQQAADCVDLEDPFAQAYDVNLHKISFPEGTPAPTYKSASTGTSFYLGGTEFWQKWPGGENPTYSYYAGTPFGQRCMHASARRFEAIMAVAPETLLNMKDNSGWGGSFFNWNDDFSESTWGDGSSARLWAWRTTLVKWISQTNRDGSCYLPTLEMVRSLADKCAARAASSEGEIQGCTN